ncbi:MAG TPA: LysR family transcriptional regulator [Steroidobacteraceae bacterium]
MNHTCHRSGQSAEVVGNGMAHLRELNLRYLYEAAKLGSMRAAGDNLGIAVSSVSRQIAQLEADIGVDLIEHGRRNILLTEAGKLLIAHYATQLRLQEALDARLADIKGLRTGRIDLAVGEGFIGEPLSHLLVRFNARHPAVRINVHMSASSNEVARLVAEDDVHLGLVFQASDDPRIRVLASMSQSLCAIMKFDHPLAGHRRVKLAELTAYRLCLPQPSFRTRELLQAVEAREGISLQPALTCNSITLLKGLLASGEFFTLLPLLAVSKEIESRQFAAVPIDSTAMQGTAIQLISRLGRRLPPAPSRMVRSLTTYLKACGEAMPIS